MRAIPTVSNLASDIVVTLWTPVFVGIFIAVLAYALWPRNQQQFDAAARRPLSED